MTCEICSGKGYYYIDDYTPEGWLKYRYSCPRCEAGKSDQGGPDLVVDDYHCHRLTNEDIQLYNRRDDI